MASRIRRGWAYLKNMNKKRGTIANSIGFIRQLNSAVGKLKRVSGFPALKTH